MVWEEYGVFNMEFARRGKGKWDPCVCSSFNYVVPFMPLLIQALAILNWVI
ncbi:45339_t:CDS:2 [Gigaspora margarita]|uniref:45339_t:CDS:1 n=1 Tax=Gigaspora margarita TaxID=4874 RepID=A0ABM8W1F9_GIGMA|nr:45339_t:CDS:2 [Gigaspora margarita]